MNMTTTPSIFAVAKAYGFMPAAIRKLATAGIEQIARDAASKLRQRTPGQQLPKGWDTKSSRTAVKYSVEIVNTDERAYKLIPLRDGRSTNLIEILEYGTSPSRDIVPVNAKALRFVTKEGNVVFTKRVVPSGIRPYGMIRLTYTDAYRSMAMLQFKLAQMIVKMSRGGL